MPKHLAERELFGLALQGEIKLAALKRAENTRLGYAADWKTFSLWCRENLREYLPASSETVLRYCHSMLSTERRVSTVIRHLSAINSYQQDAGYSRPASSEVWQYLMAVRRVRGELPQPKQALTIEHLRAMCNALPDTLKGCRDRLVLTLGYGSALRRSSLVLLDLADVEIRDKGLVLTIRKEKQDRKGEGRTLGVLKGEHPETCPVRALDRWLSLRGPLDGPLLTPVIGRHVQIRRLLPAHIARIVKDAARAAGLDPARFAGHSMRAGMVTTALEQGCNEVLVAAHTGHKSLMTLRRYFRRVDPFRANVSGNLGL